MYYFFFCYPLMLTPYFRDVSLFIVIARQKLKVSYTPPRKRTDARLVGRIGPSHDTHPIMIVCRGYLYRSMAVGQRHEVEKRRVWAMVQQPIQCNKPPPPGKRTGACLVGQFGPSYDTHRVLIVCGG
jgi:hypothetical protein